LALLFGTGGEKSARLFWKDRYIGKKVKLRCWKIPIFDEQDVSTEVKLSTMECIKNDDIPFSFVKIDEVTKIL
tara:strand:+ start:2239 stop:2457 length:219 start_codon:yes stop_codon:yes gene_type:complete